ncbi:MAG TPA: type I-C CRISPR-associated protein Cas8c/Csd1, partial [Planctomycetota bacterium]|nr:type I-C CRISPR-associated protein Cas8c/Csd1 [Planctomycetota bacterium]
MILQALTHYYDRLKDDPESGIPPFGFGREPISWALVLDRDGNLVQIRDLREAGTRTKIAKRLVV